MLDNILASYRAAANSLSNWQQLDKNELANLYLDQTSREKQSVYAAALICRYWYKVGLLWRNNQQAMSQEECYWVVCDGILQAMKYAAWRNPSNSLYQDPNGPDKAINICIETKRKEFYDFSSRDKRRTNHKSNISSLEGLYELTKDYSYRLSDQFDETYETYADQYLYINSLIHYFAKHDMLPEALLVDLICYGDSVVESKDGTYFSARKLIYSIHAMDNIFAEYFSNAYSVPLETVQSCVEQVKNLSRFKLLKLISRTLYSLRQQEEQS